jgi:predicted N-acetyltransferase YhbS
MDIKLLDSQQQTSLETLFQSVFSDSEGEEEGRALGVLVSQLAATIDNEQILCLGAYADQQLVAAIFFSRLTVPDPVSIYMLSPVAVRTDQQGKGIGQTLINHGLNELKTRAVDVAVTYGDPAYYSRVGFHPIPETRIKAPHPLSMPQGWLAQSLSTEPIPTISKEPTCVPAFNNPTYW